MRSLDLLPDIPVDDLVDGSLADSIFSGEGILVHVRSPWNIFFSDRSNIFLCQFREMVRRSSYRIVSSFICLIFHVVCMCSDKKMAWIDTSGSVACMQNEHPSGNGPSVQCPRNTVGHNEVSLEVEPPVPMRMPLPLPHPAIIVFQWLKFIHEPRNVIRGKIYFFRVKLGVHSILQRLSAIRPDGPTSRAIILGV